MEKYFIVTEQSKLHQEYFSWKQNVRDVNEVFKTFTVENEIEAERYHVTSDQIGIVPTEEDEERFGNALGVLHDGDLRYFKKNSKVNKAWIAAMKAAKLHVKHRPMVPMYFSTFGGGRFRTRLFDQDDTLYASIEAQNIKGSEGFEEIKASEFFKVMEKETA